MGFRKRMFHQCYCLKNYAAAPCFSVTVHCLDTCFPHLTCLIKKKTTSVEGYFLQFADTSGYSTCQFRKTSIILFAQCDTHPQEGLEGGSGKIQTCQSALGAQEGYGTAHCECNHKAHTGSGPARFGLGLDTALSAMA